jgi:hypothetical protein
MTIGALPAVPHNADSRTFSERLNRLIREFNRPDLFVPSYAVDTGSGAAYVTSPSTDVKVYEIGQEFGFKAANANTTLPQLRPHCFWRFIHLCSPNCSAQPKVTPAKANPTKKKPRATAGLKLNERYEEKPDRARAGPATLVAGSRVDRNAGLDR